MKVFCALIFCLIVPLDPSAAQIRSEDPVRAITQAFEVHEIVMVGDLHGNKQGYELVRKLIGSADFADQANDIVMEIGNASSQDAVDKYVAGENVPFDQVQAAWRNSLLIDSLTAINMTDSDLVGTAYGTEVSRRLTLLFGASAEPFATKRETPQFTRPTAPR
jgi:hypothetical protein